MRGAVSFCMLDSVVIDDTLVGIELSDLLLGALFWSITIFSSLC